MMLAAAGDLVSLSLLEELCSSIFFLFFLHKQARKTREWNSDCTMHGHTSENSETWLRGCDLMLAFPGARLAQRTAQHPLTQDVAFHPG